MFSNTDYAALLLAVVALISPAIVEVVKNNNERKKISESHEKQERKEQFATVIDYLYKVNDYLAIIDSSDDISEKAVAINVKKREAYKLKSIVISNLPGQRYNWDMNSQQEDLKEYFSYFIADEISSEDEPIKVNEIMSPLANTIECIQNFIDNGNSETNFTLEIKVLLDISQRLLSDYYHLENDSNELGEYTLEFIKNQKIFYQQEKNKVKYLNEEINESGNCFDINFSSDDNVEEYYNRVFGAFKEKYSDNFIDRVSGISGKLSKTHKTGWKTQLSIPMTDKSGDTPDNSKSSLVLNTGISLSDAQKVAEKVWLQLEVERPSDKESARTYLEDFLKRLKKENFEFKELKRPRKGYYFTNDENKLGNSSSNPLSFTDNEQKTWYLDMNLTKDEAYLIAKNIFLKNSYFDKTV